MAESFDQLKYILLQVTTIPSLICDVLALVYFVIHWKKEIIQTAHNHAVLGLLLLSFLQKTVEVPFLLYFFRWGSSLAENNAFCLLWNWLDYVLTSGPLQILAWFCIERYLFAFHGQMMKKKWCLAVFHYVPLTVCFIYAPCFYAATIIWSSICENSWDYTALLCGGPCYLYLDDWDAFDSLFNYGFPTVIILAANMFLFVRIIWQKIKSGRIFVWHHHRWMIIQLCLLSFLNLLFVGPGVFISVIEKISPSTFEGGMSLDYVFFLSYFVNQFLPFAIVGSLPDMRTDARKFLNLFKQRVRGSTRVYPSV